MIKKNEKWVNDSDQLVYPSYSYWTLGYALSLRGAKKLLGMPYIRFDCPNGILSNQSFYSLVFVDLAAQPLDKMIPVDEFLPIMFNQHQNVTWKNAYPTRNLIAWSAAPLLLFPTHYIGDDGYLSDTEESAIIENFGNIYMNNYTYLKEEENHSKCFCIVFR